MKAYKLTPSNRALANFFQGISIDEEKSILWSEQDLSKLGCTIVDPERRSLPADCLPEEFPVPFAAFVLLPILLAFQYALRILTVCEVLPSRRIKKIVSLVRDYWLVRDPYIW